MKEKVEVMVEEWLQVVSYMYQKELQDTSPNVGMCVCVCVCVCVFVHMWLHVVTCGCVRILVMWLCAYISHVVVCVY